MSGRLVLPTAVLAAWQDALAAEHQAYFAYGLLGPQLDAEQQSVAYTYQEAHATIRDATAQQLTSAGQVPVTPLADYPALYPVVGAKAARRLATRVEDDCAAAWRYLYGVAASGSTSSAAGAVRSSALTWLTASAVRAAGWRHAETPDRATVPFPGI